jgi:hypothetical protein
MKENATSTYLCALGHSSNRAPTKSRLAVDCNYGSFNSRRASATRIHVTLNREYSRLLLVLYTSGMRMP